MNCTSLVESQAFDRAISRFAFASAGELVYNPADGDDASPRSRCGRGWKLAPEPTLGVPELDARQWRELVHAERQSSRENDASVGKGRALRDEARGDEGAGCDELALAEAIDLARAGRDAITGGEEHVAGGKRDRDLLEARDCHGRTVGPGIGPRVIDEGCVRRRSVDIDAAGHENVTVNERDRAVLRARAWHGRRLGPLVAPRVVDLGRGEELCVRVAAGHEDAAVL